MLRATPADARSQSRIRKPSRFDEAAEDDLQAHATPTTDPLADFRPLSQAEEDICTAARTGVTVGLRDRGMPVTHPQAGVRAALVRFLATQQDPGRLVHERGFGLSGMRLEGTFDLAGCEVRRPLRFFGCHFEEIELTGANLSTLTFTGGRSDRINADRCVAGALFLRGFFVDGGMRLLGALIAGDLDCSNTVFLATWAPAGRGQASTDESTALGLDGATVSGAVFLRGARFQGSVVGDSLSVGKMFDARGAFICSGKLGLESAVLGGDVLLRGCAIRTSAPYAASPYPAALDLTQARIAGSLRLSEKFQADGTVELGDARIGGSFSIRDARLMGAAAFAVNATCLQVDGAFELDSRTCFGAAESALAEAGLLPAAGSVEARHAALNAAPACVPGAALDLTSASVGCLSDEWARWPRGNRIVGFRYKSLGVNTFTRARWWVRWIDLQADEWRGETSAGPASSEAGEFKPQAWDQVVAALRAAGCDRDAVGVLIAKESAEHPPTWNPLSWSHVLWGWCTGFGYRPLRLLWALPFIYVASFWIYSNAADHGAMAPTREELLAKDEYQPCHPEHGGNWAHCALAPGYPDFSAAAYALQMLLPAIELRQAKDWAPVEWDRPVVPLRPAAAASGAAAAASTAAAPRPAMSAAPDDETPGLPRASTWGRRALYCSWAESTLGLAAPVLVGLALSGLIRRKLKD